MCQAARCRSKGHFRAGRVLSGMTGWLLVLIVLGSQGVAVSQDAVPEAVSGQARDWWRARLETMWFIPRITVEAEGLPATEMLPLVYTRRRYQPVWSDDTGPYPRVEALRKVLRTAEHEGCRTGEYHLAKIDAMLAEFHRHQVVQEPLSPDRLADSDVLLTDAFLTYSTQALSGRNNPQLMTNLVLNPSWYVSPSIAREEILPLLHRDPEYLAKQHMRVYRGQGAEWQELNPRTIHWSQVSATHFPYRLRYDRDAPLEKALYPAVAAFPRG